MINPTRITVSLLLALFLTWNILLSLHIRTLEADNFDLYTKYRTLSLAQQQLELSGAKTQRSLSATTRRESVLEKAFFELCDILAGKGDPKDSPDPSPSHMTLSRGQ